MKQHFINRQPFPRLASLTVSLSQFDEPVGLTNGTVKGHQVFDAGGERMGGFIRGKNVKVGDFPERDLMDELDDSDEDEL